MVFKIWKTLLEKRITFSFLSYNLKWYQCLKIHIEVSLFKVLLTYMQWLLLTFGLPRKILFTKIIKLSLCHNTHMLWIKSNWLTLGMCSCKKVINHSEALGPAWRQCAWLLTLHGKPYPLRSGGWEGTGGGCYLLNHYKLRVLLYWENLPEIWNTNYKWGKKLFKKGFSVYKVESDCPPSQATVVLGSTVVFPPFLCKRYQQGWSAVHPCIERWSEAWDSHSRTQILAAIRNSAHGQWEGPKVYRDPARSWTGLYLYGPWRSTHPCQVSLFTCCWLGLRSARVTLSNPTT